MLTVLTIWIFYVSNVNTPLFVPLATTTAVPTPLYAVPPAIGFGEFSSATACEAAGAAIIAKIKAQAAPNQVVAGYACNKKA